jgi:hypothetical protein
MTGTPEEPDPSAGLRAHSTSPRKTVLTEPDNCDGWIATDHTVDVLR